MKPKLILAIIALAVLAGFQKKPELSEEAEAPANPPAHTSFTPSYYLRKPPMPIPPRRFLV